MDLKMTIDKLNISHKLDFSEEENWMRWLGEMYYYDSKPTPRERMMEMGYKERCMYLLSSVTQVERTIEVYSDTTDKSYIGYDKSIWTPWETPYEKFGDMLLYCGADTTGSWINASYLLEPIFKCIRENSQPMTEWYTNSMIRYTRTDSPEFIRMMLNGTVQSRRSTERRAPAIWNAYGYKNRRIGDRRK